MESAALTLGIPSSAVQSLGKIQFVTYNANSTIALAILAISAAGVTTITTTSDNENSQENRDNDLGYSKNVEDLIIRSKGLSL
jgi:hypothetical protein